MANIQLLVQTSGFVDDRCIIITFKYDNETKEYSVYTIHHNDYGSINTLITSTFSFRLAEEAYRKNVQALEFEDFQTLSTWTKYYEFHKMLHDSQVYQEKEFEYEIY